MNSLAPVREPRPASAGARYRVVLATTREQVRAAQALRFLVFNLELGEGLARSYGTGRDADRYDDCCDHLVVEDVASGAVVGTYRLQTGERAAQCHGYYCEREFDFSPYEPWRDRMIELGRACIHAAHRNYGVLSLLWNGIAAYAAERGARFLIGCSSLTSQDAAVGAAVYRRLEPHWAAPAWRTLPTPPHACPLDVLAPQVPKVPKLLAAYLALGATLCAPPAIDREFGTIDFLTLADLDADMLRRRGHFAGVVR
jgi:putative hemolysin